MGGGTSSGSSWTQAGHGRWSKREAHGSLGPDPIVRASEPSIRPATPNMNTVAADAVPLRAHKGQKWSWTVQEEMLAAGHVPRELWWPIPVVCRGVNHLHQTATKLLYPQDIPDFLEHELQGELWLTEELDSALQRLYNRGGGTFDPAEIVRGPTEFGTRDQEFGHADPPRRAKRPYSDVFPEVSDRTVTGVLGQFLQWAEKYDKTAARAQVMLKAAGHPQTDLPQIEEEMSEEDLPEDQDYDPIYVDTRHEQGGRKKVRRRRDPGNDFPAMEFMTSMAKSGRTRSLRAKRGSGTSGCTVDLLLLNSSGRPQLLAALQIGLGVAVIMNQEHHCRKSAFVDLQYDARDSGWTLVGSEAHQTPKDGISAGVAVVAKAGIAVGPVGNRFDHSPPSAPGRVTAAWVHVGPKTGIVVISVYLFHTEELTARNKAIVNRALAIARSYGSPWIIAGDFNTSPEMFLKHWGNMLEAADAYVVAPSDTTHRPRNATHRTLDFAICSASAEPWIDNIFVDEGFHASPHRAVRVKLRARPNNYLVQGFKRPRAFAKRPPTGCPRQPVLPQWAKQNMDSTGRSAGGHAVLPTSASVDDLWPSLCYAMENELCRLHGHVNDRGLAAAAYTGRAAGLRVVQRLALPMRASASLGKVSIPVHALEWMCIRVRELACISRKIERGHFISQNALRQWTAIMSKVTSSKGLPSVVRKLGVEWEEKLEFIRAHNPGEDTYALERICEVAHAKAESMKLEHFQARTTSWQQFVDRQLKTGAAAAHRLVKRDSTPCTNTASVGEGPSRTSSPQGILEQDLEEWRKIWHRLGDQPTAPWRSHKSGGTKRSKVTADDVGRASRSFCTDTSMGCDSFPPSAIASLSAELRECIAEFLNLAEQEGAWPERAAVALMHLIPKTDGGRRPIGVLPSIVRIWERIRKPVVQAWLKDHSRSYDWASQGRSSEGAVWHQSLIDEAATADGLASASTLMDLAKAFEMVSLQHVWAAGIRHGFPLDLLVLILEAFAFARNLVYQGSVSEPTLTLSAVLAGGGFAQVALYLVMIDPLDRIQAQCTIGLTLCLYVDDIGVHVVGHEDMVATTLAACTGELIHMLEDELGMKVSRRECWAKRGNAKTVVAVSSQALARRLSTSMRRLGVVIARKAKHLGVDFGPGARTRSTLSKKSRWAANAARRARTVRLGRRLGKRVFATGLKPAVLYGSTVAALGAGTITAMRRAAGRAIGKSRGRSLTARLAVNQCDPGWDAVRGPIMAWANEAWLQRIPTRTMQRAWMHGHLQVHRSSRPHVSAGGAAGSFFAAIQAVGWRSPAHDVVITIDGTQLALNLEAPKTVERYLADDYHIVTASSTSLLRPMVSGAPVDLAGGHAARQVNHQYATFNGQLIPWFEPAASVINAKRVTEMAPSVVASVASMPEGGWWTQASLHAAGLASDPFCRLCHHAVGDLPHRLFWCEHRNNTMESKCPQSLEEWAAKEPDNPLFSIGVPIRPHCPAPPPACEEWIGTPPREGAAVSGVAYTDGALKGTVPKARRGGWAFVVDDGASPMWGKFGTCSDAYATVLRTELRALSEILRITVGPATIYVDNAQVVDGVANGRRWCCNPRRDGADIWREIWDRLDDLHGIVSVQKVKAHLSYQKVREGRISWKAWVGNGVADMWAKWGCSEAERLSPSAWVHAEWNKACALYRWALLVAAEWIKDTEAVVSEQPGRPTVATARAPRCTRLKRGARPHELWKNSVHGWCRLCGIQAPWAQGKHPAAFGRPCLGSMGTRCGMLGREYAASPRPHSYDEGCIPLAVLRASGAEKGNARCSTP